MFLFEKPTAVYLSLSQVLDWSLKYRFFDLKKIIVFVLDEADVMIATQGHQVRATLNAGSGGLS